MRRIIFYARCHCRRRMVCVKIFLSDPALLFASLQWRHVVVRPHVATNPQTTYSTSHSTYRVVSLFISYLLQTLPILIWRTSAIRQFSYRRSTHERQYGAPRSPDTIQTISTASRSYSPRRDTALSLISKSCSLRMSRRKYRVIPSISDGS